MEKATPLNEMSRSNGIAGTYWHHNLKKVFESEGLPVPELKISKRYYFADYTPHEVLKEYRESR